MSTAVWVILSVAGLIVGFLAGYGRRRRRANAIAERRDTTQRTNPRSTHPTAGTPEDEAGDASELGGDAPDAGDGVVVDATFGVARRGDPATAAREGQVIDLRRPHGDGPKAADRGVGPEDEPVTRAAASAAEAEPATDRSTLTEVSAPAAEPTAPTTDIGPSADTDRADEAEPTAPTTDTDRADDAQVIDLRERVRVAVPVHNLQFVRGIGPRVDLELRRQGIVTLADLAGLDRAGVEQVAEGIEGISAKQLRTRRTRAREMLDAAHEGAVAPPPDTTALRLVEGIGSTMARWLETHAIVDLEALAALDRQQIDLLEAQLVDYPGRIRAERWVKQARAILKSD